MLQDSLVADDPLGVLPSKGIVFRIVRILKRVLDVRKATSI